MAAVWVWAIVLAADGSASRRLAAHWLGAVRAGQSLPDAMREHTPPSVAVSERAFARRLCHQVLRARNRLDARLTPALQRPPKPAWVRELLLVGLVQLEDPDCPGYAAINTTVEAAPPALRGLVNAILRKASRGELPLPAAQAQRADLATGMPPWLHAAITADWGDQATAVLAASNALAPMGLRVNQQRGDPEQVAAQLRERGLEPERIGRVGLSLRQGLALEDAPEFAAGVISVQNPSAQCAAELLPLQPGGSVLDACAAPGGKTAHLLECEPTLEVVALDADARRLADLEQGLERLGVRAHCVAQRLQDHHGGPYAAILLDVPCSATGILRRHPDIRWLRRPGDLSALVAEQTELLHHAWSLLAPGGTLLYASCSILRAETERVLQSFLQATADAREVPFALPAGEPLTVGWRIPPGGAWDGFYYARLHKNPTSRTISS